MGTVVWQLNDIWPVASWASIDYYGRWKALHYAEKRMFAPILISCEEKGELSERPYCIAEPRPIEKSAHLNIANETMEEVDGIARYALRKPNGEAILIGKMNVKVPPLSSVWLEKLDFSEYDELSVYFSYEYEVNGTVVSSGTCLFTAPKHFPFEDPQLSYERRDNQLIIKASKYAKSVEILSDDEDIKLSDNYFDLNAEEKVVTIVSGNPQKIRLRSVYDIAN